MGFKNDKMKKLFLTQKKYRNCPRVKNRTSKPLSKFNKKLEALDIPAVMTNQASMQIRTLEKKMIAEQSNLFSVYVNGKVSSSHKD